MKAISDIAHEPGIDAGARNLLLECVGMTPGDRLLLVCEENGLGYYDDALPEVIERTATDLGAAVRTMRHPLLHDDVLPEALGRQIDGHDHTIFLSRIGDQIRFWKGRRGGTLTMCYALDLDYLGSRFANLSHDFMDALKSAFEECARGASTWRIACPLGTEATGLMAPGTDTETRAGDLILRLFPVTTFNPISCRSMTGTVALSRWLTGTGSRIYDPYVLDLEEVVFVDVVDGRINKFDGNGATAGRVAAHYDAVAGKFGIERDVVHSWHAGLNPHTFFKGPAEANIERWAGVAFGSPRYLHFHTCGDYAPGEICWSLFDCSVWFDDDLIWDKGRFAFVDRPAIVDLMARHSVPRDSFESRPPIGV